MILRGKTNKMLQPLWLLILIAIGADASASTICSFDCPESGGGGAPALPQIVEFIPLDQSTLNLENDGLVFLDSDLFNNLEDLVIEPSTSIYDGLSDLPTSIVIPDSLELVTLSYTGGITIIGGAMDYVLLRQFGGGSVLNLSSTDGIVVLDTNTLFAVPLPASATLLLSGFLAILSLFGRNKVATQQTSEPKRLTVALGR